MLAAANDNHRMWLTAQSSGYVQADLQEIPAEEGRGRLKWDRDYGTLHFRRSGQRLTINTNQVLMHQMSGTDDEAPRRIVDVVRSVMDEFQVTSRVPLTEKMRHIFKHHPHLVPVEFHNTYLLFLATAWERGGRSFSPVLYVMENGGISYFDVDLTYPWDKRFAVPVFRPDVTAIVEGGLKKHLS